MHDPKHPFWRLSTLVVMLAAVAGYMHLFYANGIDPMKDAGLLGVIGAMATIWNKINSGDSK